MQLQLNEGHPNFHIIFRKTLNKEHKNFQIDKVHNRVEEVSKRARPIRLNPLLARKRRKKRKTPNNMACTS